MFHVGIITLHLPAHQPIDLPPMDRHYSALVTAEAIDPSNVTQILDLQAKGNNEFTPAYADPSGASDLTAVISVDGGNRRRGR